MKANPRQFVRRCARERKVGRLIGLAAILVLTGCADKHWAKPGATAQEFNRDSYECAREARQSVARWGGGIVGMINQPKDDESVNKELYRACVQARGYERVQGGPWKGIRD